MPGLDAVAVAVIGEVAAAQLAVGHRQAVLVGMSRRLPAEALGCRVGQRAGAGAPGGAAIQDPRLAEIGHLGAVAEEQDVLRLEVAMLEADPIPPLEHMPIAVEIIDRGGDVGQVAEQFFAGDSAQALRGRFQQAVSQGAVRQLHADDQDVLDLPGPEADHEVRVSNPPDHFQGPQFGRSTPGREVDELQCDEESAGSFRLPDLPESPPASAPDQPITRHRLIALFGWLEASVRLD